MKRIDVEEVRIRAARVGLRVQQECGGYRFVADELSGGQADIYPSGGMCAVLPLRELYGFLRGAEWYRDRLRVTRKET